jgi:hypothetical protein
MEIFILLISAGLIVLILTLFKFRRKLKITFLIFVVVAAAVILLLTTLSSGNLKGGELVSAFLAGSSISIESNVSEIPVEEMETEWNVYNHEMTDLRKESNSFSLRPDKETLWGKKSSGPMIYRNAEGNFFFSSLIRTRKYSDTLTHPTEKAWQLGGIILRDPADEEENNIFIAVGRKDADLYLEVKSTSNGKSVTNNYRWPSGDAELMIRRETSVFGLYARPYGTKGEWLRISTYYRPDLPNKLQAGVIAYSYSYGKNLNDFIAYFDEVNIRRENEE